MIMKGEMTSSPQIQFDPKMTLDGLLTFLGGLLAFYVIWRQTRHADRGLAQQLEQERSVRLEETARRKTSLLKALVFEMDNFYRIYLCVPNKALQDIDPKTCSVWQLPPLKTPSEDPFPIYRSSAALVGELEGIEVRNIVRYYGEADSYIRTLREYRLRYEKLVFEGSTFAPVNEATRAYLAQIKAAAPEMIRLTFVVTKEFCDSAKVPFDRSLLGVAGESYPQVGADA
jgi:hypothetical protein